MSYDRKNRVPSGPSKEHYQALRDLGARCHEIAEWSGIPIRTLRYLYQIDTVDPKFEKALLGVSLDEVREAFHPTEYDEILFLRLMQPDAVCILDSRLKPAYIREAIRRGFGYGEVQEWFRVSGTTMKKILNKELSNA